MVFQARLNMDGSPRACRPRGDLFKVGYANLLPPNIFAPPVGWANVCPAHVKMKNSGSSRDPMAEEQGEFGSVAGDVRDRLSQPRVWSRLPALDLFLQPGLQVGHDRPALALMEGELGLGPIPKMQR